MRGEVLAMFERVERLRPGTGLAAVVDVAAEMARTFGAVDSHFAAAEVAAQAALAVGVDARAPLQTGRVGRARALAILEEAGAAVIDLIQERTELDPRWWVALVAGDPERAARAKAVIIKTVREDAQPPATPEQQRAREVEALTRAYDPEAIRATVFLQAAMAMTLSGVVRREDVVKVALRAGELAAAAHATLTRTPGVAVPLAADELRRATEWYVTGALTAALDGGKAGLDLWTQEHAPPVAPPQERP